MVVEQSGQADQATFRLQDEKGVLQEPRRTAVRFELLVKTVDKCTIFLLDEFGHILTRNAGSEEIKGYTSSELVGEHFSVFYRDEDVEAGVPDRLLREAGAEGRIRDGGWRVHKDGSALWSEMTITVLQERDDFVGDAEVPRASTQRRREQALRKRKEDLENLIATISHDLRTPLNVAAGNVQLAIETGDLSRLDATTRALDRIDELLDYLTKLAHEGKRIREARSVDLREVAGAAWSVVETDEAELAVEEGGALMADRQRLQELFENLFKNAVDHAGPDVTVRVGPLDGEGFYVEDDGPGIPENRRAEVFDMGHSENPDGTGFGLAICKQIVDAHGWVIGVTEGSAGGTRIEVSGVEVTGGSHLPE